jgi:hypothetical protein
LKDIVVSGSETKVKGDLNSFPLDIYREKQIINKSEI